MPYIIIHSRFIRLYRHMKKLGCYYGPRLNPENLQTAFLAGRTEFQNDADDEPLWFGARLPTEHPEWEEIAWLLPHKEHMPPAELIQRILNKSFEVKKYFLITSNPKIVQAAREVGFIDVVGGIMPQPSQKNLEQWMQAISKTLRRIPEDSFRRYGLIAPNDRRLMVLV